MLHQITDYSLFKEKFLQKFNLVLSENPQVKEIFSILLQNGTAFIIGGFLRDIANDEKSRDIDVMFSVSAHEIQQVIIESHLNYTVNRFGGVKILSNNFQFDLWSIDNNWYFKEKLIKTKKLNNVDNIASGLFYNYDSLVIDIQSLKMSVRYYNRCVKKNVLDINRKNKDYKKQNPTVEANIIRAFFLKEQFNLSFSDDCADYLIRRIKYLKDNHE